MIGWIDLSVLLLSQMPEPLGSGCFEMHVELGDMFVIPFSQENALLSQSDAG